MYRKTGTTWGRCYEKNAPKNKEINLNEMYKKIKKILSNLFKKISHDNDTN